MSVETTHVGTAVTSSPSPAADTSQPNNTPCTAGAIPPWRPADRRFLKASGEPPRGGSVLVFVLAPATETPVPFSVMNEALIASWGTIHAVPAVYDPCFRLDTTFVAPLPDTPIAEAFFLARRLQAAIAERLAPYPSVGVTYGVARVTSMDCTLLTAVNRALAHARRNRLRLTQ